MPETKEDAEEANPESEDTDKSAAEERILEEAGSEEVTVNNEDDMVEEIDAPDAEESQEGEEHDVEPAANDDEHEGDRATNAAEQQEPQTTPP